MGVPALNSTSSLSRRIVLWTGVALFILLALLVCGLAIILISSDLPEVLAMSDRILVLHEGRITAEIPRTTATEEGVMYAATGNLRDELADPADSAVPTPPPPAAPEPSDG